MAIAEVAIVARLMLEAVNEVDAMAPPEKVT